MKGATPLILSTLFVFLAALGDARAEPTDGVLIWDDKPAHKWDRAYPVGNGRLGAMPWGCYPVEQILLNEETIWQDDGPQKVTEDAADHLQVIRELVARQDYYGADRYFEKHLQDGRRPNHYELAGWINIRYPQKPPLAAVRRSLDLPTGIAVNQYTLADGNIITQSVYASAPHDVIVVEVRAEKPISFSVSMNGPEGNKDDSAPGAIVRDGELVLERQASGVRGTRYVACIRSHGADSCRGANGALEFSAVTSATLIVSVATDVNRQQPAGDPLADGWQKNAQADLKQATALIVDELRREAIADHRQYFERVDVDFGTTAADILALPTGTRIERLGEGAQDDPDLVESYFQFGRYLLIASSRPGTFPANLQGLWNPHTRPPWRSDYHLNINLQMNYWPAETTNLGELQGPVFDLIRSYQPQGRELAKRYGMKGWAMGHATDLWGNAQPMSTRARWGGSFLCGQWLTFQILNHYRFNRDPSFLESQWDVLTAATEFAQSWLIPGPDGKLVARPAASPENEFTYTDQNGKSQTAALSAGTTYDQYMILEVFENYLEAAAAVGKSDDPYVAKIAATVPRIYRPRIANDGRLMEWLHDFGEKEPGHRHMSHLIGAYPGNQIDLDSDPKMRQAVIRVISYRLAHGGGVGVGWSQAWMIGMFARLSKANDAYENLRVMLAKSTLPSLLNNRRPFQIDGNFGATAAIAEMLMHSHKGEIKLLPALPTEHWPDGSFNGLRARGDYTVDVSWRDGKLAQATIHAGNHAEPSVNVVYRGRSVTIDLAPGEKAELNAGSFLVATTDEN